MKRNSRILSAAVLIITATAAQANNEGVLQVGGVVASVCTLEIDQSHPGARPMDLMLNRPIPQMVAAVYVWCNTGQSTASVTYESLGGGLVNQSGGFIDYVTSVSGTYGGGLASAGPWTTEQWVGPRVHFVRVRPLSTGNEMAGIYTDTIQVTLAAN